jgi:hypothetical protein
MVHEYVYVAAAAGMRIERVPELKFPDPVIDASEKVTLWAMPSEFVHVTVAPGATTMSPGTKALFCIVTAVVAVGPPGVTGGVGVVGVVGVESPPPPPQPKIATARANETRRVCNIDILLERGRSCDGVARPDSDGARVARIGAVGSRSISD